MTTDSTADVSTDVSTGVPGGFAALGLFSGASQVENFPRMYELVPARTMPAASTPRPWPTGAPLSLPESFTYLGTEKTVAASLADTETASLLVLHRGEIRHEHYALTGGPDVRWISMSVAKSFVSALVGLAVEDGAIGSIDDVISDYVEVPAGSAYDGVVIRDVLRMASGARWNEDYSDTDSDAFRLAAAMSGQGSLHEFVGAMSKELEPGTVCRYNSGDTQALGLLVRSATGRSLADYMHERLVEPLGFTAPSAWLVDAHGVEAAFACLTAAARDFARLGECYRHGGRVDGGRVDGVQVVPEAWVRDSIEASAPPMEPLPAESVDNLLDYGYQWWLPKGAPGAFSAIGVYNQFVYVDREREVVTVKQSANRTYGSSVLEADNREVENLALLQAIVAAVADTP